MKILNKTLILIMHASDLATSTMQIVCGIYIQRALYGYNRRFGYYTTLAYKLGKCALILRVWKLVCFGAGSFYKLSTSKKPLILGAKY